MITAIAEIESRLSLQTVLDHYNIKLDRNGRTICPWHDDKTPSLQVYLNTNSWTCFSSNCSAGSGDQIDMIRMMESLTTSGGCIEHEAFLKAKAMAGHEIKVS